MDAEGGDHFGVSEEPAGLVLAVAGDGRRGRELVLIVHVRSPLVAGDRRPDAPAVAEVSRAYHIILRCVDVTPYALVR